MKYRSIYVHFPFCESKCHYCDFYSIGKERTTDSLKSLFLDSLKLECELRRHELDDQLDTVFFGGGTPSMTPPSLMRKALKPLDLENRLHSNTEWTMEANPSSVQLESLIEYRSMGINRISMGVQTTHPEYLKKLGRVHSKEEAEKALESVFKAGFNNVSVDLLCGIPNQTLKELDESIESLNAFPITHLSCYLLTLPKSHAMASELPSETEQLNHLLFIDKKLASLGFRHYEISNFCRNDLRAKHNMTYWTGESYLGFGPSAHSYDTSKSVRFKNWSSLSGYSNELKKGNLPVEWSESLSVDQIDLESWLLSLRLDTGTPRDWLKSSQQRSRFDSLKKENYIEIHPNCAEKFRLTPKGLAMSDEIVSLLCS